MSKIAESSLGSNMTSSVTEKTPISANERRRHTDTPSLWIAIAISSVSLHLLVFWFMRSSNVFKPWFPEQNEIIVPIEFIEIPSPEESLDKSNLEAEKVSPQPSVSTPAPETAAPTTPSDQDTQTINSDASLLGESETETSEPETQVFPEKTVSTPTPTPIPTPTPTPTPTTPVGNLPWNNREEVVLGKGQPLPTDIPSFPSELPILSEAEQGETARTIDEEILPIPTGETPSTPAEEILPTPTGETPSTPAEEIPPTPTGEIANTPAKEGARVTFTPVNRTEVDQLIQESRLSPDGIPDVLAEHIPKGSNTNYILNDSVLEPAQFLVSLVIDNNGNFQQAIVLEIEPARLQSKSSLYEQVVKDIFNNDRFLPAENNDGTKPEWSNLFMRITIQP